MNVSAEIATTEPDVDASTAERSPLTRRRTRSLHLAVIGSLLVFAVIVWGHVWLGGHPTHTIACQCGDPAEEVWWLGWVPWAIGHGHNPFFTNAMYAGTGGVNSLTNVSIIFPALLLSPVTLLFGPVASFNVIGTLSPVISGYCMFLFARKFTRRHLPAFLAALLWAFSPSVLVWLPLGHLGDVLGFFFPLALLLLYDLLYEGRRRPEVVGLLLALLVVAQFFTSTEVLGIAAVMAPFALLMALILARDRFTRRRRAIWRSGVVAVVISTVVLAYPAWYAVAGPRHVKGQPWVFNAIGEPISAIVNPGPNAHTGSTLLRLAGYWGPVGPAQGYLGWILVALVVVAFPLWRRRKVAIAAFGLGVWAWMLSWGVPARGGGLRPWRLFNSLPVLTNIRPFRFTGLVALAAAILLAVSVDQLATFGVQRARLRPALSQRRHVPFLPLLAVSIGVACLVPIIATYSLPLTQHSEPIPPWFRTDALRLPPSFRILTIPYDGSTMVYQAEDSFSFEYVGGYALVPTANGRSIWASPLRGPSAVLTGLTFGVTSASRDPATSIPSIRYAIRQWRVDAVVIARPHRYPWAVSYFTKVLASRPLMQGHAAVWYIFPAHNSSRR